MMTNYRALELLDSFAMDIPNLYPKPRLDYRGRVVNVQSVKQYLMTERHRLAEIAAMLPDPPVHGARLLDVGIAYGFLPVLLKQDKNWRCEGLELPENIPAYCAFAQEHGIIVHPGKLGMEPLPFPDTSFHAIIFSEVLEHLRLAPPLIFQELKRLLANRGFLIVTTPNIARLTNIMKLIAGRNPMEPFPENVISENITDHLTHIREYTMAELTGLLERNGFDVRCAHYSGCMERNRPHGWITPLVPPWRGSLMVLAQK